MSTYDTPSPDWVARHAKVSGDTIALHDVESGRRRTYAEFDSRIDRLSGALIDEIGLGIGERVAVLSKNDIDVFEIQFACQRACVTFAPLNWRLTVSEIAYILDDCEAAVLVYGEEFEETAETLRQGRPTMALVDLRQGRHSRYEEIVATAAPRRRSGATATARWSLIYTSGTTGRPKGAELTYEMIFHHCVNAAIEFEVTAASRNLVLLPTFHTGGLNVFANPVFMMGGTNVVLREFDPDRVFDTVSDPRFGITHFMAVPTMHRMLQRAERFRTLAGGTLRHLAVAGEPCAAEIIDAYEEIGLALRQFWGMTEAGPVFLAMPSNAPPEKRVAAGRRTAIGEAEIRDRTGTRLIGKIGELVVRGPNVSPGYLGIARADGDGWFATGDAAIEDVDGFFRIVDRWKDMFISGGENVYPAEIERVVLALDDVTDCAVVGVPHETWGECGRAFVVLAASATATPDSILAHCETALARFKIPKDVVIVPALPRNASGKVLKHKLRQWSPTAPIETEAL